MRVWRGKKKDEIRRHLVEEILRVTNTVKWSYRKVCGKLGVTYSSFMRWKERMDKGQALLKKPGPDKVEPFDVRCLHDDILRLGHGKKRTAGTGALYEEYRKKISRRIFQELVSSIRRELRLEKQIMMRRISWNSPGLVWSMDDTECEANGEKSFIHAVQDIGSQYKFLPITAKNLSPGKEVAAHLEYLFEMYGPPLFLKRDNHSNLNNQWVDDVLNRYMVMPLNSPPYYPPYNGAIERAQGEIKQHMANNMGRTNNIQIAAELTAYELNLKERRSLKRRCSCEVFLSTKRLVKKYDRRIRKEIYTKILAMAAGSVEQTGLTTGKAADAAWRFAVETWLRKNGHITVSRNRKVLPDLCPQKSH